MKIASLFATCCLLLVVNFGCTEAQSAAPSLQPPANFTFSGSQTLTGNNNPLTYDIYYQYLIMPDKELVYTQVNASGQISTKYVLLRFDMVSA